MFTLLHWHNDALQDYYEIKSNYILRLFTTCTLMHTTYYYVEHAGWSLNKEFRL